MKKLKFIIAILFLISCNESKSPLDKVAYLDVKLGIPKPGEWLNEHKENGQSFDSYCNKNPVSVSDEKNVIYIQPIGNFTTLEKKIVDETANYVSIFFKLKTVILKSISEDEIPKYEKRINFEKEQFNATYIIDKVLPTLTPKDGIVIMAITAKDLYPSEAWNYVFGLAKYSKRTGISSFNRFYYTPLSTENYALCLDRSIKTASHEIGHMFSLNHCINAVCLMNGVNNIDESDSKPNALCSECLKKLSWNLKYNDEVRLKDLISFLNSHNLEKDAVILQNQLNVISKK